jgi:hypothetical protein
MVFNQERKYDAIDGKIVNRASGKPIPDNEPIIIFRAKDLKSNVALQAYLDVLEYEVHKQVIQERIVQFEEFQASTSIPPKEPDSDVSCLVKK